MNKATTLARLACLSTLLLFLAACGRAPGSSTDPLAGISGYEKLDGYFDLYWDDASGHLLIAIETFGEPFLYQSSLARGVGSNDIGLDRGQLGDTRVVRFERSGPRVLMVEENLGYRALSDDQDERLAVQESFASAVTWGFESLGEHDGKTIVDGTDFFLRDSHSLAATLAGMEEGTFSPDPSRSAIYLPNTMAFPDNTEVEAIVTFTGDASGRYLHTVTPDWQAVSVYLHHSFIRLPDDGYEPLPLEPRSGYSGRAFQDYSSAVGDPLRVAYTSRHRLEKKDPNAEMSEAVEPIVYYVDRGAPEPIRSALIEGAEWWNEAFEAAGYRDAFQVRVLPEDAHPMDVRYNVIQWVHRSTRGWSYGNSIRDPRTGEILKGKVTLGSLRVRQDYLIAQGLLSPFGDEEKPDAMLEMALARVRQLSAHEVGHTLGIQHNMAASAQGRASVMDYPHPTIRFDDDGEIDLSDAYDTGIGDWDERVILYGYQDFPDDVDERAARAQIMADTIDAGFVYVADRDSRPVGGAHPIGHLWDNGADALEELEHLLRVREMALGRFSERNIRPGEPMATLEEVLVPLYLLHRFQLIAAGKFVGGSEFSYAMRGDGQDIQSPVSGERQRAAMAALIETLGPDVLRVPDHIRQLIPPRPPGHPKSRETFPSHTGAIFEPLGAAQSAASLTLDVLLEPTRAARMVVSSARDPALPGFDELTADLLGATWFNARSAGTDGEIQRTVNHLVLDRLMSLAVSESVDYQVRAIALDTINQLDNWLSGRASGETATAWRAHYGLARFRIDQMRRDPASVDRIEPVTVPPGEPIGTTRQFH